MLVLTRRQGESLVFNIGESEIIIKLIVNEDNQAKLGISASAELDNWIDLACPC